MLQPDKNIALVVNPLHVKAGLVADALAAMLKEKNIEHYVFTSKWPNDWTDITEVWIVGGDGTLNYFINQYPQIDLPLAIFKGGAGNDFHWRLYGNSSMEAQVKRVLSATPQPVDAGLCNKKLFINGVGIGFDGKIARNLAGKQNWRASYLLIILKSLFRFREFLCAVNTENFHWGKKCLMISVANGKQYGGGYQVMPKSLLNDGLLDTNIVGKIHPFSRIRYLPLVQKGSHLHLPFITYVKSALVIVKTLKELPAHLDGEPFFATEFNIECLPSRFLFLY